MKLYSDNKLANLKNVLARLGLSDELNLLEKIAGHQGNIEKILGYPKILAQLLDERFGKHSFLIAKWIKEYHHTEGDKSDWMNRLGKQSGGFMTVGSLKRLIGLYDAISEAIRTENIEPYNKYRKDNNYYVDKTNDKFDPYDLIETKTFIKSEILDDLEGDIFFYNSLAKAILLGEIKDLNPYKELSFSEACDKYNKKKVFIDAKPLKIYPEGYRWIDVGRKCELVGKEMKNCGSAGVMSMDPAATIVALFDANNKPHVMVTYSPGEKRISGDEGGASTAPKDEYSKYILDLAVVLGAEVDTNTVKSKFLGLSGKLKNIVAEIKRMPDASDPFTEVFWFKLLDGTEYYTDTHNVVSLADMNKVLEFVKQNLEFPDKDSANGRLKVSGDLVYGSYDRKIKDHIIKFIPSVFNHQNVDLFKSVCKVKYDWMFKFISEHVNVE